MAKILPFSFITAGRGSLVDGSDGDLVVLNGQTVQLTAGNIYSYNSIDIQVGGVLEIIGAEAITQVGCKNNFICNGTFRGKTTEDVALRSLGSDNWLGSSYNHTQVQSVGGRGGNSGSSVGVGRSGGLGGSQSNGHAGGGGGSAEGSPSEPVTGAIYTNGGNGQSNGQDNIYYMDDFSSPFLTGFGTSFGGIGNQGGHGSPGSPTIGSPTVTNTATAFSASSGGNGGGGGGGAGVPSEFTLKTDTQYYGGNGGAGGGARGEHGRHVYILAEKGITGSGLIDFAGNPGYNGGGATFFASSGGGGGGAGGSGGAIWIRHYGDSITPTITSSAGAGGSRSPLNTGGVPGYYYFADPARDPANGSAGGAGILDIQAV